MRPNFKVTKGRIEFRDVCFAYRPEETVLHSISFAAEAGKTTALVGRSGGGKSTVMSLILRLYEVESGQILCDGQRHRDRQPRVAAPADRLCRAGEFPVQGFGARQHCDGKTGRQRRRDHRRRQGGLRPRFHHGLRARLQFAVRRARHAAFGRTASAHRHRARVSEGRADHSSRRSDFGARFRSPSRRSRRRCEPCAKGARRSSSPTACRPWRRRMKSASSTAAISSSAGATANSWPRGAPTATSPRPSFPATRPDLFIRKGAGNFFAPAGFAAAAVSARKGTFHR